MKCWPSLGSRGHDVVFDPVAGSILETAFRPLPWREATWCRRHVWIVYPGPETYRLDERVTALPLSGIGQVKTHIGSAMTGASPP